MEPLTTPITAPAKAVPTAQDLARQNEIGEAVQAFESVLLGELTALMFSTVKTDGPFGGGHAEEMYRGMMTEHLGTAIAKRGGLNLVPSLMNELIRMQGGQP